MPGRASTRQAAALLASAVERRVFPAAAVELGDDAGPLWRQAFGALTFAADASPTTNATIFDLASLTKPIATTTAILDLVRRGRLHLDDAVSACVPEWTGIDRAPVTIADLLEHCGGLSARLVDPPPTDRRAFEHEICAMPLEYEPRSRALYSDLGFLLLGFCAERAAARPLAAQTSALLNPILAAIAPADSDARLLVGVPPALSPITAPTAPLPDDRRRGRRLAGEVHDSYAAALGGFAGHAGLFGTAAGVGGFARAVLRAARNHDSGVPPLTPDAVTRATRPSLVPGSSRALGWDTMRPTSSCGAHMSAAAFGHVGFTGTSLWIDPTRNRYFVLLTNRVCDGGTSDDMQQARRAFHDALADV
jgi:CubicO group peptidase (beta-lactamase class C family)